MTQETKGGIIKSYTYDAMSNRTGFILTKDGTEQINSSYTYDALNRLTGYSANGYTTAYGYDANSNMTTATKADGSVEASTYNLANLCTSTYRTDSNGDTADRYTYKYYYDGKIYSKKNFYEDLIFSRFKYDGAGRISMDFAMSDTDDFKDMYTYDSRGNIISVEHTDNNVSPSVKTNISYTYDKTNRLLSKTNGTDTYTYSYLSTGETSSVNKNGSAIRSYGYDAAGRLASSVADGISATYTYDGDNMRQSKTVGGITTNEIYDGANLVATITSGNVNKYLRGTRLEAYQTPSESGMYTSGISNGIIRTMPFDTEGNTSELNYDLMGYTAFGKYLIGHATTDSVNPFGYNGEVTDTDTSTGLIYLRNRYYDPEIGRFLTVDPAMDGTNWYSYCNNDPVNFEDPWGLYDRTSAVAYAINPSYSSPDKNNGWISRRFRNHNPKYERFDNFVDKINSALYNGTLRLGSDCTNFVSQVLVAGGISMTDKWHYYLNIEEGIWLSSTGNYYATTKKYNRDMTSSWCNASDLYRYVVDSNNGYINGEVIWLNNIDSVRTAKESNGVQAGDLLFFHNEAEGVHHVAVITGFAKDGTILYSAHSNDRINELVNYKILKDDSLIIVKLKDDAK